MEKLRVTQSIHERNGEKMINPNDKKTYTLTRNIFFSWLNWLLADLFAAIFMLLTFYYYDKSRIFIYVCAVIQIFIMGGLVFNYTYSVACRDRLKAHSPDDFSSKRCLLFSIGTAAPFFVTWLALFIAKLGVYNEAASRFVYSAYRLLNFYFNTAIYSICGQVTDVTGISWLCTVLLLVLCLIPMFVAYITYEMTFRRVDVKKAVLYSKKK